jgi:hypothetical protein
VVCIHSVSRITDRHRLLLVHHGLVRFKILVPSSDGKIQEHIQSIPNKFLRTNPSKIRSLKKALKGRTS